jgi:glycosyltransferase involved in cell wall biosynthesis
VIPPAFELDSAAGWEPGDTDDLVFADDAPVALYTGAIGAPHESDIRLCLRALAEVQRRGVRVRFVHAGATEERRHPVQLAAQEGMTDGTAESLGYLSGSAVLRMLRQATVLVQPGAPSDFNRLRLPAKLPSYLASGTPTVTFAIGAGELLEDRSEVLKTYTASPSELADRLVEALTDSNLRARLQTGGPAAARRLFDPEQNASALEEHYRVWLARVCNSGRLPQSTAPRSL